MAIVILSHQVADYASWKPHYDGDSLRRKNAGIKDVFCGQKSDDPNLVYMIWETENPESVDQMLGDPDLAKKMQEAGVISKPEVVVVK